MKKPYFDLSVEVEKETGKILAVYLQVRKGHAAVVHEFADGNAFANYNRTGQLLGIELLGPCEIKILDQIARKEPKQIKDFFQKSIPRQMVLT